MACPGVARQQSTSASAAQLDPRHGSGYNRRMSSPEAAWPPSYSQVEMTQIVLPGDANSLGNAFGGAIMQWIDIAAGVAARRHASCVAVTASIDSMQFHRPIQVGDVVVLRARVNRAWRSSMEVGVRVTFEQVGKPSAHAASAYLTFVAVNADGRPERVPRLRPETDDDQRRHQAAGSRRRRRLQHRESDLERR